MQFFTKIPNHFSINTVALYILSCFIPYLLHILLFFHKIIGFILETAKQEPSSLLYFKHKEDSCKNSSVILFYPASRTVRTRALLQILRVFFLTGVEEYNSYNSGTCVRSNRAADP